MLKRETEEGVKPTIEDALPQVAPQLSLSHSMTTSWSTSGHWHSTSGMELLPAIGDQGMFCVSACCVWWG